jgi:hypothetical protein
MSVVGSDNALYLNQRFGVQSGGSTGVLFLGNSQINLTVTGSDRVVARSDGSTIWAARVNGTISVNGGVASTNSGVLYAGFNSAQGNSVNIYTVSDAFIANVASGVPTMTTATTYNYEFIDRSGYRSIIVAYNSVGTYLSHFAIYGYSNTEGVPTAKNESSTLCRKIVASDSNVFVSGVTIAKYLEQLTAGVTFRLFSTTATFVAFFIVKSQSFCAYIASRLNLDTTTADFDVSSSGEIYALAAGITTLNVHNADGSVAASPLTTTGRRLLVLVKYSSTGYRVWNAQINVSGSNSIYGATCLDATGVYIAYQCNQSTLPSGSSTTLNTSGTNTMAVIKYSFDGAFQWQTLLGGSLKLSRLYVRGGVVFVEAVYTGSFNAGSTPTFTGTTGVALFQVSSNGSCSVRAYTNA